MNRINIVIADDHPMIIQGIQQIINNYPQINLLATFPNGDSLLKGIDNNLPDILLLDIQMPDITGDELVPVLLEKYPDLKIIMLTNFDSPLYAQKTLWQGAKGFVLKTADELVLIKAIETVHSGLEFIDAQLKDRVLKHQLKSNTLLTTKLALSMREKEVLQLIVEGNTDQEIAEKIFLGLNTIKHYRKSILLKLDVKNTAALVNKALKLGLAK